MATSRHAEELAYATETTQGEGEADFANNGTRIRPLLESVDMSNVIQAMIEDMRSQEDVLDQEKMIFGIKGGVEFPFEAYVAGSNAATTGGMQKSSVPLVGGLLSHALGGEELNNATTAAVGGSHTATAVELDDATNYSVGGPLGWVNTDGLVEIRRITDITLDVATVDQEFSGTPQDSDVLAGCAMYYIDQSVLVDSTAGSRTLAWWYSRGRGSGDETFEFNGCRTNLTGFTFGRNDAPKMAFNTLVGSFTTPEAAATPAWSGDPDGEAPLAVGPNCEFWMEDYGTSTITTYHATSVGVEPGITCAPQESVTEKNSGMPGRAGYFLTKADSIFNVTLLPYAQSHLTDFNNATLKQCRYAKLAAPGYAWAVGAPRVQITPTPGLENLNDALGTTLRLKALRDTTSTATTELWRTRWYFISA